MINFCNLRSLTVEKTKHKMWLLCEMQIENLLISVCYKVGNRTWLSYTFFIFGVLHCYQGRVVVELPNHSDVIRDLNFAPDGSLRLASASRDGTLRVWLLSMTSDRPAVQYTDVHLLDGGQSKWMYGCCWSPDANLLASVGDSRSVWLI